MISLASPLHASGPGGPPSGTGGDRASGGDGVVPVAIVLRSRAERLRFLRPIQAALGLTGLIAVLLATGIELRHRADSHASARRDHRDDERDGRDRGPHAEDRLAPAALGRRGRAAAGRRRSTRSPSRSPGSSARRPQRERLSALGRLSTVIAHEVRNPLMIIKASLKPLERDPVSRRRRSCRGGSTSTKRSVASTASSTTCSISPAPSAYDLAEADINRICAKSAAAAVAGGDRRERRASPSIAPVPRCRHRRGAVSVRCSSTSSPTRDTPSRPGRASHGADRAAAPSRAEPTTKSCWRQRRVDGRLAITVRDRGTGIAAGGPGARLRAVLHHQARRHRASGSPISRNIIEGLGGTISDRRARPGPARGAASSCGTRPRPARETESRTRRHDTSRRDPARRRRGEDRQDARPGAARRRPRRRRRARARARRGACSGAAPSTCSSSTT